MKSIGLGGQPRIWREMEISLRTGMQLLPHTGDVDLHLRL